MLTEKHNELYGWKNKLDALTGLPGEAPLGKNVAWEKLHSRLQEKPRNKKTVWYWAAACLLLALTIPLMIANKKENIVVRNDPPQKQQAVPVQMTSTAPVTAKAPIKVEKNKVENRVAKDQQITVVENLKKEEPVTAIAQTTIEKEPVISNTDTITTAATTIPVKKKLPVVHINELEPAPVQFYTQPNYVQRSFKIKFKNGKAANQTVASQQQYEGGFQIKLSPKN